VCFGFNIYSSAEVNYILVAEEEASLKEGRIFIRAEGLLGKKVAVGLKKAIPCVRIGTAVIGLQVPHAHIHLIPMNDMRDVNFANPKLSLSAEKMKEIAEDISKEVEL